MPTIRKAAPGKTMLGLTVGEVIRDEIDVRAASLNLSRSAYAALVMEDWRKRGFPPVTEPDRLMQVARSAKNGQGGSPLAASW